MRQSRFLGRVKRHPGALNGFRRWRVLRGVPGAYAPHTNGNRRYVYHTVTVLAAVILVHASAGAARANERHFTYTYESAVLPPGEREFEIWVTPRVGREDFYSRFDLRAEFETSLTDRLQTALYLNSKAVTEEGSAGKNDTDFKFAGVSSEWKYKLSDPVADPLGLALYGEVTASTDEVEVEGKLIADKRSGNWLLAANAVAENEWEFEAHETERSFAFELDLGVAYFLRPRLAVGLEFVSVNKVPQGEGIEHAALFTGPVVAYGAEQWWVAATLLPQLPALKGSGPGDARDLDEHEKVNGRLLVAFHF